MSLKSIKILIVIFLFTFTLVTCINPVFPKNQLLQHLGTIIISIILFVDLKKNKLTLKAFSFVGIFILIHIIGARWIYSHVPYQEFISKYFHENLADLLVGKRNHYDRFVHLFFGILFIPFLFEYFHYRFQNYRLALLLAWLSVQTFSMLYEVFEWSLTVMVDPIEATEYNGQQNDFFDPQKDMALAMLGSTIVTILYFSKKKTDNEINS
tara:strand:- start:4548 stop:5177 length:630 start_codon:yes stop_codon:yes gene_type:complete